MKKIRVGLIGAKPGHGWAGVAHVPAIRAVESLDLAAVATRGSTTADDVAEAFGALRVFSDPFAMVQDPEIDLVSVVVKAPEHFALVMAAIAAGKSIYCEWPLGVDVDQTRTMASAAAAAGVRTAIGLQGRASPWIRQVRQLVADGYVGRVLSTSFVASDLFSTGQVARANSYMLDVRNGANPLTIHGGHFLDCMTHVLGDFVETAAVVLTSRPEVHVQETGESIASSSPDQIVVAGRLASGAAASVHIRAGRAGDRTLQWEIQGDRGFLRISSTDGYVHWRSLVVEGAQGDEPVSRMKAPDADCFSVMANHSDGPVWNIARHYAHFAKDIFSGRQTVAGFEEAVRSAGLVERIKLAAMLPKG